MTKPDSRDERELGSGKPEPVLPEETLPSGDDAVAELVEGAAPPPDPGQLGIDLPDNPTAAQAILMSEVASSRQEAGEYLEALQRVAAEFDNYRKRVERDQGELVQRASQRMIEQLLPTLDNFDAALAYETQTPTEEKILDGMRGTHAQLLEVLAREGLEPVAGIGGTFDPAVHEAVSGPNDPGEGELVVGQELRRGYTLKGRVIRPALVIVEHG